MSKVEFRQLDYEIMQNAFATQNDLGRFCDEEIYQKDLSIRLNQLGISFQTEARVEVKCDDFRKIYFLDLVIAAGAIYELKAVTKLAGEHESQLLNYLFLTGAEHGKLVNFRSPSVKSRFVNAAVPVEQQRIFQLHTDYWTPLNDRGRFLFDVLMRIAQEWGVYLELNLYVDAITHFLGGEEIVVRDIPLCRNGMQLGRQKLHLISDDVAFRLTGITKHHERAQSNLRRLLALTPLSAIHWINFDRHDIQLVTLLK